jgi:hypothetical protein
MFEIFDYIFPISGILCLIILFTAPTGMTILWGILLLIFGLALSALGRHFMPLFAGLAFFYLFRIGALIIPRSDKMWWIIAIVAGSVASIAMLKITRSRQALTIMAGSILTGEMLRVIVPGITWVIAEKLARMKSPFHAISIPLHVQIEISLIAFVVGCLIWLVLIRKMALARALTIIVPAYGGMLVGQAVTEFVVRTHKVGPYTEYRGTQVVGYGVSTPITPLEAMLILLSIWGWVAWAGSKRQRKQLTLRA